MTTVESTNDAPSLRDALSVWARIGLISFGGPAGQIALMHRILVDERRWIDEETFLRALNFCMLLPGPEAMQLATYVGWRLHGIRGGLYAGLLFVLPGAALMLALALAYAAFGQVPVATALFVGVKAAVLAIVLEALLRVARRALRANRDWFLAAAAFLALYVFNVPFPLIVLGAALIGFWATRAEPQPNTEPAQPLDLLATGRTIAVWGAIWLVPLFAVAAIFGRDHVLSELAWLFSKLAVVTFGGAYAVLSYLAQEAVHTYGWLRAGEMLDALGLAETTPGPLILVTEFVGVLAAWREGGGIPWVMGVLGALVTLWATFAPCFLWIFAGAPYIERLNKAPRLRGALAAITAAVVGVILNLTVWFATHALFAETYRVAGDWMTPELPVLNSLRLSALGLSLLSAVLLFLLKRGVLETLAVTAFAALALSYLGAL